jgi:methylmalonyl-CoA/ethylmalonyl-CoA epimerase
MNWKLDHIGIAVRSLPQAREFYLKQGGYLEGEYELLEKELVEVLFLEGKGELLELISPLPGNESLTKFLEKRGEGLHHLCYRVDSIKKELERLKSEGIPLVDNSPRLGSRGLQVAFLHPKASASGVLVELCSSESE